MQLYALKMGNEVICDVATDYAPLFGVTPRLNPTWLRKILASALSSYFLRRKPFASADTVFKA